MENQKVGSVRMTASLDTLLRPTTLNDCVGLKAAKVQLRTMINSARITRRPLGHILFSGGGGVGKTTLALAVANELHTTLTQTTGEALGSLNDRDSIDLLSRVCEGGMLFVDECHQLNRRAQDTLLPLLERGQLMTQAGNRSRKAYIEKYFQDFTCLAATTAPGSLQETLKQRFERHIELDFYSIEELTEIAARNAGLLGVNIANDGLKMIASRAKGVPRIANNILKYARHFSISRAYPRLGLRDVQAVMSELEIGELGLTKRDKRYLGKLASLGKPMGIRTLAANLREDQGTIQEIEGYLMQEDLIEITTRGRCITDKGLQYLERSLE